MHSGYTKHVEKHMYSMYDNSIQAIIYITINVYLNINKRTYLVSLLFSTAN